MTESILQTFLNQQFIKTSDAGNIESLSKAVAVLKSNLSKKKQQIIPYTLVALDPQISEIDPVIAEVESIIIKNWSTFKNSTSTKDKPTTYVRIVILQALSELAKDSLLSAIIWLTGRNVLSYYQTQKEHEPISNLLTKMGNVFELDSRQIWSVNEPKIDDVKALSISIPSSPTTRVNVDSLTEHMKAAAVYTGWSTQAGGGENPSPTNQNNWSWSQFFSERASTGIADVVNSALVGQDKTLTANASAIQKDINEYFTQFKFSFGETAKALKQATIAANKRADLLWWKQTLYSPFLDDTYRKQTPIVKAIAMASDLSNLIGLIYPESVNYLLREALKDVYPDLDEKKRFTVWIESALALTGPSRRILKPLENTVPGRKSLGSSFANILNANDGSRFLQETGIDATEEISLSDLAVWILHDLQAAKISVQK